jgi:Pterin-4a-carbinolamine dehydratase
VRATVDTRDKQHDRNSCEQNLHSLPRGNTSTHTRASRGLSCTGPRLATAEEVNRIERSFRFRNFREALTFVQEIGELAEAEGHHPNISFGWGNATVSLQTKKIKGLHENDFIMATKIDRIFARTAPA